MADKTKAQENIENQTLQSLANNRIRYVEPNFARIYRTQKNEASVNFPQTPDYEDFCISCQLYVETKQRIRSAVSSGGTNVADKYTLSWITPHKPDGKKRWQNFHEGNVQPVVYSKGNKLGDKKYLNYLSTFYTDINFNDVKRNDVVQGMGISSVKISYESWYYPTVSIQFVDVRGSSLFAREEAVHNGNTITADTVFGCLFTQPYPQFRLQVKGFYGDAVTFQLRLYDFKGSFDANSGDFNINCSFIGSPFGILAEIPMWYLINAPYSRYAGMDYWNKKKNTPEWQMDDGGPMMTIVEFQSNIEKAVNQVNNTKGVLTEEEQQIVDTFTLRVNLLQSILNDVDDFDNVSGTINTGKNYEADYQLLIFSDSDRFTITRDLAEKYKTYVGHIDEYTNADNSLTLAKPTFELKEGVTIDCKKILNKKENGKWEVNNTDGVTPLDKLTKFKFNGNNGEFSLNSAMANKIAISINDTSTTNIVKEYAALISFGTTPASVARVRSNYKQENIDRIQQQADNRARAEIDVAKIIGFKPYIGNVFKMVMCHLETFIHTMFTCANNTITNKDERLPEKLGINMSDTDVSGLTNNDPVPPFPAVYTHGDDDEADGTENYIASWVGDIPNTDWEEERLILSYIEAGVNVREAFNSSTNKTLNLKDIVPIIPIDLINGNPFSEISLVSTPDMIATALGVRVMQIFSMNASGFSVTECAKADAYNMAMAANNYFYYLKEFFNKVDGKDFGQLVVDIVTCKPSADEYGQVVSVGNNDISHHTFESISLYKENGNEMNHHPMYKESGGKLEWVYMRTGKDTKMVLIPTKFSTSYQMYCRRFKIEVAENGSKAYDANNTTFDIKELVRGGGYIFTESENNIISNTSLDNVLSESKEPYINQDMYMIFGLSESKQLYDMYKGVKQNGFTLRYNEGVVENLLKNSCGSLAIDFCADFYENGDSFLHKSVRDYTGDTYKDGKNMIQYSAVENESGIAHSPEWLKDYKKSLIKPKDYDKFVDVDGNEATKLVVYDFPVYDTTYQGQSDTNDINCRTSLFGHPFFYLQNEISDAKKRNYVKALLFLNTFSYHIMDKLSLAVKSNLTTLPYAYVLLVGAYIWRYRQSEEPINWGTYRKLEKNQTLLYNFNSKTRFVIYDNGSSTKASIVLDEATINKNTLAANTYMEYFTKFADSSDFTTICDRYEVALDNGGMYKEASFKELVKKFSDVVRGTSGNFFDVCKPFNKTRGRVSRPYSLISTAKTSGTIVGVNLKLNEDDPLKTTLADMYYKHVFISLSRARPAGNANTISTSTLKEYANHWLSTLKTVVDNYENLRKDTNKETQSNGTEVNSELALGIYSVFKRIWDGWLISRDEEDYTVKKFFNKFVFIDKFYRNMYSKLIVDCSKYNDAVKSVERITKMTAYTFLSNIVEAQRCMLFTFPDYLGFNLDPNDDRHNYEEVMNLFTPIPFMKMRGVEKESRYIVMYNNDAGRNVTDLNNFRSDSFDIWAEGVTTNIAPSIYKWHPANNKANELTDDELHSKYAYNIPSFGVSFASQNQSIFTTVDVNMSDIAQTAESINAWSQVLEQQAKRPDKTAYYGQDIYGAFSNYMFQCHVTMMGNARIMPLMYFQLLNIPMFRGTYMIFKVEHSMSPGDMTTDFYGTKLTKRLFPYNSNVLGDIGNINIPSKGDNISGSENDRQLTPTYKHVLYNNALAWTLGKGTPFNDAMTKASRGVGANDITFVQELVRETFDINIGETFDINIGNTLAGNNHRKRQQIFEVDCGNHIVNNRKCGDILIFTKIGVPQEQQSEISHIGIYLGHIDDIQEQTTKYTYVHCTRNGVKIDELEPFKDGANLYYNGGTNNQHLLYGAARLVKLEDAKYTNDNINNNDVLLYADVKEKLGLETTSTGLAYIIRGCFHWDATDYNAVIGLMYYMAKDAKKLDINQSKTEDGGKYGLFMMSNADCNTAYLGKEYSSKYTNKEILESMNNKKPLTSFDTFLINEGTGNMAKFKRQLTVLSMYLDEKHINTDKRSLLELAKLFDPTATKDKIKQKLGAVTTSVDNTNNKILNGLLGETIEKPTNNSNQNNS